VYRSIFGGWGGQTAARTCGFLAIHSRFEQRENRSCGWWRQPLKIEQLPMAAAFGRRSGAAHVTGRSFSAFAMAPSGTRRVKSQQR